MVPSVLTPSGPVEIPGFVFARTGAKIIPVHHSGPGNLSDAPAWYAEDGRTTIQAALDLCRSGRGDVVQLLPGHTETISGADAWSNLGTKTGVTIRGPGFGPPATITWATATTTALMDAADFVIDGGPNRGIILQMEPTTGSVNVAAPITVSAARCKILNTRQFFGTDANNKVTIGITTTAGADYFEYSGNHAIGATAAECTTFLQIVGADGLRMFNNVIEGATSAVGVGIVRFATTASLNIWLENNTYINRKALSTCAVTGLAGVSGVSRNEHFAYLDTSSLTPWLTSTGIMTFHRPTVTNTAGETGTEVVGTVSA